MSITDSNTHNPLTSAVLLIASLVLVVASCIFLSNNSVESASTTYKNAVYIYMCGSTLETKNAIATNSLSEMLDAYIPSDTAVIIETGGARKWRGYDIDQNSLTRYQIKNGELIELGKETDASMGDSSTLTDFINFCNENYASDNATFVFWDHGAGSVNGVCLDENHSLDGLTPAEINESFDATNSHFKNVCFDACLMANFETMRVVAEHAETMIASQEIEPAAGWDCKTLVENAGNDKLADSLLLAYKDRCDEKGKTLWTLSSIDLKKFNQVESAFDGFCSDILNKKAKDNNLQSVTNSAIEAMSFGEKNAKSDSIDLSQFAENLGYSALTDAIKDCTQTVNGQDRQGASGVSIFFPLSATSSLKDYLQGETNDEYKLFLGSNFENNSQASPIEFLDEGSVDGTSFNFKISPSSTPYVQSVVYDIYQLQDSEPANCLGFDDDIEDNEKGEYSISFSGNWVCLNGNLLTCEPIDRVGDTSVFTSPVKLNGSEGDLRFTFNSKTREFSMQGFVALEENDTQGRLEDLEDGDKIEILSERFLNLESLDTEYITTATVTVDDNLELSTTKLPDGSYQIYAIITDIYGDESSTSDFLITLEGGKVAEANVAGVEGVEPSHTAPETAVLPLDDTPIK